MKKTTISNVMKVSFISTLLFNTYNSVYASTKTDNADKVLEYLYKEVNFNGNVLLVDKGKIIYNKSFGYSNLDSQEKLNSDSIFELASISKQFTAMAIVMLKERKQLNYDDLITKFIPEFPYKDITIRNLLHHTSGLPDYMELIQEHWDKNNIAVNKDVIDLFIKYKPEILFKPGEKYEYSNTGYMLLASIIEKASKISYREFLRKNIFDKLGMNHSMVYNRRLFEKKVPNYAYGYTYSYNDNKYHLPDELTETKFVVYMDGISGDGTVNSTVNDLYLWDRALYTSKLVSKNSIDEIFTSGKLNNNEKTDYGFGWGIKDSPEGKVASHGGRWVGYSNFISRYLDEDKTIIFLTNKDVVIRGLSVALDNIIHDKPFALPYIYKNKTPIKISPEAFNNYIGEYSLDDTKIVVSKSDNKFFTQVVGQESVEIYPETESKYFNNPLSLEIEFSKDKDGKINELTLTQNGGIYKFKKIK